MKALWGMVAVSCLVATAASAGYPLDGYEKTGIRRLLLYQLIQDGKAGGNFRLEPGALLGDASIRLRLKGHNDGYDLSASTEVDPALQKGLLQIVSGLDPSYRVAIVDITDPAKPRYAALRPDQGYIPGSVGKLLVMTALFNELHRRFPDDIAARARVLKETMIVADRFVVPNSHAVPIVDPSLSSVTHRAIAVGDTFTLWEWADHMASPSSNAAASMVWKHAMLLRAFGDAYPPSPDAEDQFFKETSKKDLVSLAVTVIEEPLVAAGIDLEQLHLRTFFTRTASQVIPGSGSHATPRQLVRWLIKLEQGKLVDEWSSLEMKKLMYFTRRRYRYAAAPALATAAVFFKSGSLYKCRPEEGYECGQYRGNETNLMHSVAIVESPAENTGRQNVYLVSMMSNVLKVNSASEHATIAVRIERLIREAP